MNPRLQAGVELQLEKQANEEKELKSGDGTSGDGDGRLPSPTPGEKKDPNSPKKRSLARRSTDARWEAEHGRGRYHKLRDIMSDMWRLPPHDTKARKQRTDEQRRAKARWRARANQTLASYLRAAAGER